MMNIRKEWTYLLAIGVALFLIGFLGAPFDMSAAGSEKGSKKCSDGIDNDGDGLIDQDDPDCSGGSGDGGGGAGFDPAFLYGTHSHHATQLVVATTDGSGKTAIFEGDHFVDPAWSPGGEWIVFGGPDGGLWVAKEG